MTQEIFAPMDAIRFGWDGLKKNLRFFVILMIIVAAVSYALPALIVPPFFAFLHPVGTPSLGIFLMAIPLAIIIMAIDITVELGLLKIALGFRDDKTPQIEDLFKSYPLLLNYLAASIIYGLMIAGGFIILSAGPFILGQGAGIGMIAIALILILLGVYLSLKYQFFGYLIVDRGMGPIEALQQSGRLTEGALKNLFVFWLELYCGIIVIFIFLSISMTSLVSVLAFLMPKVIIPTFSAVANLVFPIINLLVILPITKLATAYIYRALETHSVASASSMPEPDVEEFADDEY
jgi:uncharacterized membrane protein